MPKVKWGISTDEPEELEQFDIYDGDDPPKGVYRGVISRLTVKENSNGDDMLSILWKVLEPKGSKKAQFNGWYSWENQNITDQGKPYLLTFLKSLGISWNDFINKTVRDKDDEQKILRIGTVKFNDGNEPACRANLGMQKASKDGQYPAKLGVKNWLPPKDEDDAEWDDSGADDDGDEEDPFK